MTTGDKTSFPCEVAVHIDIKYFVASDLLVSGKDLTIPHLFHCMRAFIKGNLHISHLPLNGELPKVSPRGLISIQGFFELLGNPDSKIMGFPPISRFDFGNDSSLSMQYILNPTLEHRLLLQLVSHCVSSDPHDIGMLQTNQGHPFGGSALPLYLQRTTSHFLLCMHIYLFDFQKYVSPVNCRCIFAVIINLIYQ